jgi:multiple sugar transport system permease protein
MKIRLSYLNEILKYCFLLIVSAIYVFPVLWLILTALKDPVDAFAIPPKWIFKPTLEYLTIAIQDFTPYLINSLIVASSSAALITTLGSLAAYGFSRHVGRLSHLLLLLMLGIRMFPQFLLLIPYFTTSYKFGLYDTHIVLIFIYTAFYLGFAVWMLRSFMLGVPTFIDEAAMVDGCSRFGAFWRVVLPNVIGGIVSTFFLIFIYCWNEFLFAFVLTGTSAKTMPPAIVSRFEAEVIQYWSISAAASSIVIIPSLIIMVIAQKYLIKGLTFGIIKE